MEVRSENQPYFNFQIATPQDHYRHSYCNLIHLHMFRMSNSGGLFFLRRETYSKENVFYLFIVIDNMEIATNFEAI